jgi:hypothetical protein
MKLSGGKSLVVTALWKRAWLCEAWSSGLVPFLPCFVLRIPRCWDARSIVVHIQFSFFKNFLPESNALRIFPPVLSARSN